MLKNNFFFNKWVFEYIIYFLLKVCSQQGSQIYLITGGRQTVSLN